MPGVARNQERYVPRRHRGRIAVGAERLPLRDRSRGGSASRSGASWRMSCNPARIERGAPDLGEHNDYVFSELATEPARRRHQIWETR